MPIELRKGRDEKLRKHWYGRYEVDGKRHTINLGVKVAGKPPTSLSLLDAGDTAFEVSRGRAKDKLAQIIEEARLPQHAEHLAERIYEFKTGERIPSIPLEAIADEWARIPRRRKPSKQYTAQCQVIIRRFVDFVMEHSPRTKDMAHVTRATARAFMEAEEARGVTAKTWNDTLKLLRTTFRKLQPQLSDASNPFRDLVSKSTETVSRSPYTVEELQAILHVVQDDDFTRPLVVLGMCTAMRRGDCCLLKWKDVDLIEGFITVKTSKTGETVDIPIFPMLEEELTRARREKSDSPYCFPDLSAMYRHNPDGISWRVKKVLAKATDRVLTDKGELPPQLTKAETRERVQNYLSTLSVGARTKNMRRIAELYLDGISISRVAQQAGCSKGTVSGHLNEIQDAIGCRLIRGRHYVTKKDALQSDRESGYKRASTKDFHSFRSTWITLALASGVPLELVQRVTGHRTAEVVMKHYFRPGREDFRSAIQKAMPSFLSQPTNSTKQVDVGEILASSTAESAWADIQRLRDALAGKRQ